MDFNFVSQSCCDQVKICDCKYVNVICKYVKVYRTVQMKEALQLRMINTATCFTFLY